jgi:hypothetical protein
VPTDREGVESGWIACCVVCHKGGRRTTLYRNSRPSTIPVVSCSKSLPYNGRFAIWNASRSVVWE